jgi:proteic killer suppression protein
VIRSFRNKALRQFAEKGDGSKLNVQNIERVRRILFSLDAADDPKQMNISGYKFHSLKGKDKGRYSVWVSGNYRITFGWLDKNATDVDLEDYH